MKFKSLRILTLLLLLAFLFVNGVVAQQEPVDTKSDQPENVAAIQNENNHFAYSPKGRRDPFKPLIQEKEKVPEAVPGRPARLKGPLERFELSQYQLTAIMVVKGVPRAMVKAPDGKSYTVKVGDYIGMNDGFVKRIETKVISIAKNGLRVEKNPDRIVVEESSIDTYTGQKSKENRYIAM
jgi:Tfp pilus assembly protein PilP